MGCLAVRKGEQMVNKMLKLIVLTAQKGKYLIMKVSFVCGSLSSIHCACCFKVSCILQNILQKL